MRSPLPQGKLQGESERNACPSESKDTFSLTPALSRWERENCPPLLEKARVGASTGGSRANQSSRMLFPLPHGEGQGEGEWSAQGCVA